MNSITALSEMTPNTAHFLGVLFGTLLVVVLVGGFMIAMFRALANDSNPQPNPDVVETLGIGENTTSWIRGRHRVDVDGNYGRHSASTGARR